MAHPLLDQALIDVGAWRVLPSARGFNVWRFRPWRCTPGGWCIVVEVKTAADGWLHVLSRLGLMKDAPPAPLPPMSTRATVSEADWP